METTAFVGQQLGANGPVATAFAGRVEVRLSVDTDANVVWEALTDPGRVALWFGDLSSGLVPGGRTRLDFGDGDFFDLDVRAVEPPHRLAYGWRFQGIGPHDAIAWHIAPLDRGCVVTVTDDEPGRGRAEVEELRAGWLDFVDRLRHHLRTGQAARYDWRRSVDASFETTLAAAEVWDRLAAATGRGPWPLLRPDGADGSARVAAVASDPPRSVTFDVTEDGWRAPTRCCIEVLPRDRGAAVSVHHEGWEHISDDNGYCLDRRRHYCDGWIEALTAARDHTLSTRGGRP